MKPSRSGRESGRCERGRGGLKVIDVHVGFYGCCEGRAVDVSQDVVDVEEGW